MDIPSQSFSSPIQLVFDHKLIETFPIDGLHEVLLEYTCRCLPFMIRGIGILLIIPILFLSRP